MVAPRIQYSDNPQQKERRKQIRLSRDDRIVVRTVTYERDAYMTTIYCSSLDASPHGLRVCLDHRIPVGHLLNLVVQIDGTQTCYRLGGEVKWSKKLKNEDCFSLGIELRDSASPDIRAWRNIFN